MLTLLRKLHLWLGLSLALPAAFFALTGVVLMASPENGPPTSVSGALAPMIAALQTAAPFDLHKNDLILIAPRRTDGELQANIGMGQLFTITPRTLSVHSADRESGWRQLREWHGNFLSGRQGRDVVAILGGGLLVMALSGLFLWWPRGSGWRGAITVRAGQGAFMFWRSAHKAIGAIFALALLALTVSGFLIALPAGAPLSSAPKESADIDGASLELDADQLLAAARLQAGDGPWRQIQIPARPSQPARIIIQRGFHWGAPNYVTLTLDRRSGQILSLRDPAAMTGYDALRPVLRSFHGIAGWSLAWQVPALGGGLAMAWLAVSGVISWLARRRPARAA
jgi:uncharacterized iron-regulated membrane protein